MKKFALFVSLAVVGTLFFNLPLSAQTSSDLERLEALKGTFSRNPSVAVSHCAALRVGNSKGLSFLDPVVLKIGAESYGFKSAETVALLFKWSAENYCPDVWYFLATYFKASVRAW